MFNNKRIKALEEQVKILQDLVFEQFDEISDLQKLNCIYSDNMNVMFNEIQQKMDKPVKKVIKVVKKKK